VCGWHRPIVTADSPLVKHLLSDIQSLEKHQGGLTRQREREGKPTWWLLWLERASYWHTGGPLSFRHLAREMHSLSFPGNRDDEGWENIEGERFAWCVAREYLGLVRPWFLHPRWHVWHWRIQILPLVNFKRWAFSRCSVCAGRFSWGESPTTNNWNATGPRWFRSEPDVFHGSCSPTRPQAVPVMRVDVSAKP